MLHNNDASQKSSPNSPESALAAFIVGCLVFEDMIQVDDGVTGRGVTLVAEAIQVVRACLQQTHAIPKPMDVPTLPFEWVER